MNKTFKQIIKLLQESATYSDSNFDALEKDRSKIPNHIRILQGLLKSHSGAELTGYEASAALKKIKNKFSKEWKQVMKQQSEVEKSWMPNET